MRTKLLNLLRCPTCGVKLSLVPFLESADDDEIIEGLLLCECGQRYPIVDTIPRMLLDAVRLFPEFTEKHRNQLGSSSDDRQSPRKDERFEHLLDRTRESFGYQWTTFSEIVCDFQENFWNYLTPATPDLFQNQLGLDAGCGFGRHIYHAAACGAEMVGMDFSRAIDSARKNTRHLRNIHLVQGDIYAPPFGKGIFDFVYSIGVLHHLPDPVRGFQALTPLLRPGGMVFIWVYSKRRRLTNLLLEVARRVTTHLPHPLVNALSFLGATIDQYCFIVPYRVFRHLPKAGPVIDRLMFSRIKMYSAYPFQVLHADWFDRLAAPIRFYYSENEVERLAQEAGIADVKVTPTGLYGWRASGTRR